MIFIPKIHKPAAIYLRVSFVSITLLSRIQWLMQARQLLRLAQWRKTSPPDFAIAIFRRFLARTETCRIRLGGVLFVQTTWIRWVIVLSCAVHIKYFIFRDLVFTDLCYFCLLILGNQMWLLGMDRSRGDWSLQGSSSKPEVSWKTAAEDDHWVLWEIRCWTEEEGQEDCFLGEENSQEQCLMITGAYLVDQYSVVALCVVFFWGMVLQKY